MNKKTLLLLGVAFLLGTFAGSSMQTQRQKQTAEALTTSPAFTAWSEFTQRMNALGLRLLQDDAATAATGGTFPVASERDRADAVRQLRAAGHRVGLLRPITLWPFPSEALARAAEGVQRVAVLEQNAGQMIDDVRLAVLGLVPVVPIGEISTDPSGFGIGDLLEPDNVRERIAGALENDA